MSVARWRAIAFAGRCAGDKTKADASECHRVTRNKRNAPVKSCRVRSWSRQFVLINTAHSFSLSPSLTLLLLVRRGLGGKIKSGSTGPRARVTTAPISADIPVTGFSLFMHLKGSSLTEARNPFPVEGSKIASPPSLAARPAERGPSSGLPPRHPRRLHAGEFKRHLTRH